MCASAPLFLARENLEMNDNSRLGRQPAQQLLQVAARKGDTARSRGKTRPRDMNEYSAAVAGNARPGVMVDFDDQIVESIGALEPVPWFIGRPPERAVIASVRGVFAPGVVHRDSPDRQEGTRARQAVRPPPQPNRMKSAGRRCAVAFAFRRLDACPAQSRADRALPCHEPSLRAQPRADVHMDCGQRDPAHRVVSAFCHGLSRGSQAQLFSTQTDYRSKFCGLTFCGHMIFFGNRFPLFRIML